ncbi:22149_t:CDS:2 [Gigaspora margarita]|uniref:22149_t:CDS:1 n=1 Tax=Gigaspora margarita TaxID=4874 RepID=A0ABN7URU3_GIGMA|nr:22149_t:CDS:2 [Gigaspora margarita]
MKTCRPPVTTREDSKGNVISALGDPVKQKYYAYSVLRFKVHSIIARFLGGNAKTLMTANIINKTSANRAHTVYLQQNYFGSETTSNLTTDLISEENKDIQILEEQLIELQNSHIDMSKKDASLNMGSDNAEMLVLKQEMKMLLDAKELNNQDIR